MHDPARAVRSGRHVQVQVWSTRRQRSVLPPARAQRPARGTKFAKKESTLQTRALGRYGDTPPRVQSDAQEIRGPASRSRARKIRNAVSRVCETRTGDTRETHESERASARPKIHTGVDRSDSTAAAYGPPIGLGVSPPRSSTIRCARRQLSFECLGTFSPESRSLSLSLSLSSATCHHAGVLVKARRGWAIRSW